MTESNNKRIAKNTLLLYVRQILILLVSLYTVRVVLEALGVEDYGIYNVVGGFVSMFAFLNGAMSSATQRFLSFELGNKNYDKLRKTFSMSINIHALIALVVFILAETVGLWFVETHLKIPPNRFESAVWVYHFSILMLMVNMLLVPFMALIVSHERMGVFAYISIIEVLLKLAVVFVLQWIAIDKLKLYAALLLLTSTITFVIYFIYCKRHFRETKYIRSWDAKLFKTLAGFAGWNLWGSMASVVMMQGVNVLLNIFFGPVVNAARGIAFQVRSAITSFVTNFQKAMNPQIVKSYAADNLAYMHQLVFMGAKYSFFLLFFLSLPVFLETNFILGLWLKTVPDYTIIFIRLVLVNALIDCLSGTLMTAAQASGKIKLYQSVVGGMLILNLPISYLFLKLAYPPEVTLWVSIIISIIALLMRLYMLRSLVSLSIKRYFSQVLLKIVPICIFAPILPMLVLYFMDEGFLRFLLVGAVSVFSVVVAIYFMALTTSERYLIQNKIQQLKSRFN